MILGIDLGTTGTKLLVLSEAGEVLFRHFEGYRLYTPKPGWSEEDPSEWWEAVLKSIGAAVAFLGGSKKIDALALSGQMHGSVFLDEAGEVIRPAILWNDTRTFNQRKEIEKRMGKGTLLKEVQNLPLEGFTAPKILWLKEKEPENFSRLRKVLLPKDYINYKLTGRLCTESTDASGTALYDVVNRRWSENLIWDLDLETEIFPEVLSPTEVVGRVSREVVEKTGINAECLVVAGGADNVCGALGAGVLSEGQMLISVGSSGVVFLPTDDPEKRDPEGRLHFFSHAGNSWYNMGVTLSAGLSLKWFKETFGESESAKALEDKADVYDLMVREAERVSVGSEGLYYLPYLNGERTPHMDAKARGMFFGISLRHEKAHFIRSVLEGVAYSLRDSIEIVRERGLEVKDARIVGGGAKSGFWTQMISDVLDVGISTLTTNEGPGFGAGILAAVGSGIHSNLEDAVNSMIGITETFMPISGEVAEYDKRYGVYRELYGTVASMMKRSFDIEEME